MTLPTDHRMIGFVRAWMFDDGRYRRGPESRPELPVGGRDLAKWHEGRAGFVREFEALPRFQQYAALIKAFPDNPHELLVKREDGRFAPWKSVLPSDAARGCLMFQQHPAHMHCVHGHTEDCTDIDNCIAY